MTPKVTGRPPTGYVYNEGGRWKVRLSTPDGQRPSLDLDPSFPPHDPAALGASDDVKRCACGGCVKARTQGAAFALQAKVTGWTPPKKGERVVPDAETCAQWFDRWHATREKKLSSARKNQSHFTKWIEPIIGPKPIRTIDRRDIEAVVEALDAAVQRGATSWKSAVNSFGTLTVMCSDACGSKVAALRVRDENPALGVRGPDRGVERVGPYLYPSEFLALVSCEAVPLYRRRLYAVAVMTYARRGELAALTWSDVHMEEGYILVHRAEHYDTAEVKSTKTKVAKRVPIEDALRPLLLSLKGDPSDPVVTMPAESEAALLRADLKKAGCTRADLDADDETRRPCVFHDLRHTGLTWRAIRGDDALKIQRAAGHDDLETTQRYLNEAECFDIGAGRPFPALPASLLGTSAAPSAGRIVQVLDNIASPGGFESTAVGPEDGNPRAIVTSDHTQVGQTGHYESSTYEGRQNGAGETLDAALAAALTLATERGDLVLVARIVQQLEDRRRPAAGNVVPLKKRKGSGG